MGMGQTNSVGWGMGGMLTMMYNQAYSCGDGSDRQCRLGMLTIMYNQMDDLDMPGVEGCVGNSNWEHSVPLNGGGAGVGWGGGGCTCVLCGWW